MHVNKLLILGIGNEILTDDSIGIRIINDIKNQLKSIKADFKTACTGGLEILEIICNYKNVIIVDAIKTVDGIPGQVYLLTPEFFKETSNISSFHDVSFLEAFELGKMLEMDVPKNIHIIAIEIIEDLIFSNSLSPVIENKYNEILDEVINIISTLI